MYYSNCITIMRKCTIHVYIRRLLSKSWVTIRQKIKNPNCSRNLNFLQISLRCTLPKNLLSLYEGIWRNKSRDIRTLYQTVVKRKLHRSHGSELGEYIDPLTRQIASNRDSWEHTRARVIDTNETTWTSHFNVPCPRTLWNPQMRMSRGLVKHSVITEDSLWGKEAFIACRSLPFRYLSTAFDFQERMYSRMLTVLNRKKMPLKEDRCKKKRIFDGGQQGVKSA